MLILIFLLLELFLDFSFLPTLNYALDASDVTKIVSNRQNHLGNQRQLNSLFKDPDTIHNRH